MSAEALQLPFDRTQSQEDRILAHLKSGRSITPLEALNLYGSFRLGARIFGLKKQGYKIGKEMVETSGGAKVASYKLEAKDDQAANSRSVSG